MKKYPGKRGLMYQPDQTLEVALMADGVAAADVVKVLTGPGGVDRAFRKLAEIKPHVHWWKSGDESMQLILTGEVDMVYAWQGRVNIANRTNNRELKIVWPAGYVSALIYFGVMKGSPRKEEAIKLIKYQLAAEPQARFAELMGYPPANADAYADAFGGKARRPARRIRRSRHDAGGASVHQLLARQRRLDPPALCDVRRAVAMASAALPLPRTMTSGVALKRDVDRSQRRHRLDHAGADGAERHLRRRRCSSRRCCSSCSAASTTRRCSASCRAPRPPCRHGPAARCPTSRSMRRWPRICER